MTGDGGIVHDTSLTVIPWWTKLCSSSSRLAPTALARPCS